MLYRRRKLKKKKSCIRTQYLLLLLLLGMRKSKMSKSPTIHWWKNCYTQIHVTVDIWNIKWCHLVKIARTISSNENLNFGRFTSWISMNSYTTPEYSRPASQPHSLHFQFIASNGMKTQKKTSSCKPQNSHHMKKVCACNRSVNKIPRKCTIVQNIK